MSEAGVECIQVAVTDRICLRVLVYVSFLFLQYEIVDSYGNAQIVC